MEEEYERSTSATAWGDRQTQEHALMKRLSVTNLSLENNFPSSSW